MGGNSCLDYQDKRLRNRRRKQAQANEIWLFCYAKQKNVPERKYSPEELVCTSERPINGWSRECKISISYAERQNLTMRMSMRRFAGLTNAF